jgi:hypothetical protein
MSDGLFTLLGLAYGITAGPSNAGNRKDGKVCTAQPGECRFNFKYYTLGMGDAKAWSDPCADDTCPDRCPYLSDTEVQRQPEEARREKARDLVEKATR